MGGGRNWVELVLFQFLCPHRLASWAGNRAGSPVSQYVSLRLPPLHFFILWSLTFPSPTVPLYHILKKTQFFLFFFHYFHFHCTLYKTAPFISAAIFPLICNTMILTFGELYPLYCGDRLTGGLEKKRCCETT
jgi:hypothetical protein